MRVVTGFFINTIDSVEIQKVFAEIRRCVITTARQSYKALLEYDIESIVDSISTNAINLPDNGTIFELCKKDLCKKIEYAGVRNLPSPYNFSVMAYYFLDEKEDKTYIRFESVNNIYEENLKKIKELNPFDAHDNSEAKDAAEKKWMELFSDYQECPPFSIPLIQGISEIDNVKPEELEFSPPAERINSIVRHSLMNSIMNSCSLGTQIQPFQLMSFFDFALTESLSDTWADIRESHIEKLKRIIVPITTDIIHPTAEEPIKRPDLEATDFETGDTAPDVESVDFEKEYLENFERDVEEAAVCDDIFAGLSEDEKEMLS